MAGFPRGFYQRNFLNEFPGHFAIFVGNELSSPNNGNLALYLTCTPDTIVSMWQFVHHHIAGQQIPDCENPNKKKSVKNIIDIRYHMRLIFCITCT